MIRLGDSMINNLIGQDVKLMRKRYNEALKLRGIPVVYQFPNLAQSNNQGEPLIDSYSEFIETHIFFEGNPKVKTFKRYGWVVENDAELPFLIHCSFDLPHLQKDSIFRIAGQYSELPDRIFRVTEITYDLQCADHLVCQVIPAYEEQLVGRTQKETERLYTTSNRFLKQDVDYRGNYQRTQEEMHK